MCLATYSHSFQHCLKRINLSILKWSSCKIKKTKNNKKNRLLRQKGLFYFHWTLWLSETAAWPWAISGPFRHSYSKHRESASHNVVLRKGKTSSSDISIKRKRDRTAACSRFEMENTLLHIMWPPSIPWLVNVEGWGKPAVNLIYEEFIEFAGQTRNTPQRSDTGRVMKWQLVCYLCEHFLFALKFEKINTAWEDVRKMWRGL